MLSTCSRFTRWPLYTVLAFFSIALTISAQQMRIIKSCGGGGDSFILAELMAMLGVENGQVTVTDRFPADQLPSEYRSIDIRKGDVITMIDGVKVTDLSLLQKHYEKVALGKELKLVLHRGKEIIPISFKRSASAKVMTSQCGGATEQTTDPAKSVGGSTKKHDRGFVPVKELGLVFVLNGGKLMVAEVVDQTCTALLKTPPKVGDHLVSLQGKPVSTANDLTSLWKQIPSGEQVEIVMARDGEETASTFEKPVANSAHNNKVSN